MAVGDVNMELFSARNETQESSGDHRRADSDRAERGSNCTWTQSTRPATLQAR